MKKKLAGILLLLFVLMLLSACHSQKTAGGDANLAYLTQTLSAPTLIVLGDSDFEPMANNGKTDRYSGTIPLEYADEILSDLQKRMGKLVAPPKDCADCECYQFIIYREEPENAEMPLYHVRLYFPVKDGACLSAVYLEIEQNMVWYEFQNSGAFVDKYLALLNDSN